jgi:cellulose synthase operon protein YhjU
MGLWAFYFLGKAYLYYRGYIHFSFFLNLLFAVFLSLPLPAKLPAPRFFRGLRFAAALVAGFLILWHETWFPPLLRTVHLLSETGGISLAFIARFLRDSVSILEVGILALILLVSAFLNKRIILTPLALLAIVSVPLLAAKNNGSDIGAYLEQFTAAESKRVVRFDAPPEGSPDFDVIILHICSLAWEDLRAVGLDKDAFFRQFDVLFTDFDTVSSYTNPSAIRLLRANCGQPRHAELYRDAPKECYVLDTFRGLGYQTFAAIDNDAPSYRFVEDIMTYGHADRPQEMRDLPVRQYDFDNSPIYDDLAILDRWWATRQASTAKRAAFYIDITTMHGGAHWADDPQWWEKKRSDLYRQFGLRLFSNLEAFFKTLEASGKNFIVVFVPEHGMALRGSTIQSPDIREIPLPAITTAPVGIKLIGNGISALPERQITVSKPASYIAISYLLKSFVGAPVFSRDSMLTAEVIGKVPETKFVAENEASLVIKKGGKVYYFGKEKKWITLPESALK